MQNAYSFYPYEYPRWWFVSGMIDFREWLRFKEMIWYGVIQSLEKVEQEGLWNVPLEHHV
jgi:hypothetical protein